MENPTPESTPSPSQAQLVPAPPSSEGQLVPAAPSFQGQLVPVTAGGPLAKQTTEKPAAALRPSQLLATDLFPGMADETRQKAGEMLVSGDLLRKFAAPMCFESTCGSEWTFLGEKPFVGEHDQILRHSGRPVDPVERMLLEQIQVAHHHSLEMQRRAMQAESLEATKIYSSAACGLQAEFRRLTGALQNYRSPRQRKQFVVVKQQNLRT